MRTRALLPLLQSLPLVALLVGAGSGAISGPSALPIALPPPQELLRGIYKELVEINTTHSVGDNTRAAEAMARHLLAAEFPAGDVQVLAPRRARATKHRNVVGIIKHHSYLPPGPATAKSHPEKAF